MLFGREIRNPLSFFDGAEYHRTGHFKKSESIASADFEGRQIFLFEHGTLKRILRLCRAHWSLTVATKEQHEDWSISPIVDELPDLLANLIADHLAK